MMHTGDRSEGSASSWQRVAIDLCTSGSNARRGAWLGPLAPLAVMAILLLIVFILGRVVDLPSARVPKPEFQQLILPGYPSGLSAREGAGLADSLMWWLCLTVLMWLVAAATWFVIGWLLNRAFSHAEGIHRRAVAASGFLALAAVAALTCVAIVDGSPFIPFGPLVATLQTLGPGLQRLANLNGFLAYVVGCFIMLGMMTLLSPQAYQGIPGAQMRALTHLMYAAAVFLASWIVATTALYRLCASLLVSDYRIAALELAPTISLMGGLFLSSLLACGYFAAGCWLQHMHHQLSLEGSVLKAVEGETAPRAFLVAHWGKLAGILLPLLPGAASALLQGLMKV